MTRRILQAAVGISMAFLLSACSTGRNAGASEMSYVVKHASTPVRLDAGWNGGQWGNANVLELKNHMGSKPEHFPKTQAKLLYDDESLYLFFRVEDQYVRAVAEEINDVVCTDSCVEFFFSPDIEVESRYLNLEVNCGGTMLLQYNDKGTGTQEFVEVADCRKLDIFHSLPRVVAEEIQEPTVWTLGCEVPFEVIARYTKIEKPHSGMKWKANFYKSAEKTSHPHWLTWSFVDNPGPHFHLPQYFGTLEFE